MNVDIQVKYNLFFAYLQSYISYCFEGVYRTRSANQNKYFARPDTWINAKVK